MSEVFYKYIQNQEDYESNTLNALKAGQFYQYFLNMFKFSIACQKFDEELVSLLQKNNVKGGSTALMCLIKKDILYVVNVGDSLCAFVNKEEAIQLNVPHTPQNDVERKKLDLKGAIIIEKKKTFRVLGELAVSRAFGDKNYKDFITAEPDISVYDLNQVKSDYLIIASDGFWNVKYSFLSKFTQR